MVYLKQLARILFVTLLGEALHYFIPLPVPAGIYGLLLMLLALSIGAIQLSAVREAGKLLVEIMPVMFIPAAVGLIDTWDVLKGKWLPVLVIIAVTTVLTMGVSGRTVQRIIRGSRKKEDP